MRKKYFLKGKRLAALLSMLIVVDTRVYCPGRPF